jgi:hypothetical protein
VFLCPPTRGRDHFSSRLSGLSSKSPDSQRDQPEHGDKRGVSGRHRDLIWLPEPRGAASSRHGAPKLGRASTSPASVCWQEKRHPNRKGFVSSNRSSAPYFQGGKHIEEGKRACSVGLHLPGSAPPSYKGHEREEDASSAFSGQIGVTFGGSQGAQPQGAA